MPITATVVHATNDKSPPPIAVVVGDYVCQPVAEEPRRRRLEIVDGHFSALALTVPGKSPGDGSAASGNLPLFRCTCCDKYMTPAEFVTECVYHPGRYTRGKWCRWECCKATGQDAEGCCRKPTHTEDHAFSELTRSLGCEPSHAEHAKQKRSLAKIFGAAFDGRSIHVRVCHNDSSVVVAVPAPPVPDIASLKTILRSQYPELFGGTSGFELGTTAVEPLTPVEPLPDSTLLTRLPSANCVPTQELTGGVAADVVVAAIKLFALVPPRKKRGTPARGADWVLVSLRLGDTLSKLALQHNLDVSTIKAANGIVGSTIEAWRDELWLPPLGECACSACSPFPLPTADFVLPTDLVILFRRGHYSRQPDPLMPRGADCAGRGDAGGFQAAASTREWRATHTRETSRSGCVSGYV